MPKIKTPPGHGGHHSPHLHSSNTSHHNSNAMDQIKIKRVKRNKKKVTPKEKILAGLGVGGALMGGIGAVAPQKPQKVMVSEQDQKTQGSASGGIKQKIKDIFGATLGVQKAQAFDDSGLPDFNSQVSNLFGGGGTSVEAPVVTPAVTAPITAPVVTPAVTNTDTQDTTTDQSLPNYNAQVEALFGGGSTVMPVTSPAVTPSVTPAVAAPVTPAVTSNTVDTSGLTLSADPATPGSYQGTVTINGSPVTVAVVNGVVYGPDGQVAGTAGSALASLTSSDTSQITSAFDQASSGTTNTNANLTSRSVAAPVTSSNASTTTYDPSLSSQISNMQATGDQANLINQISTGQVQTINGNSVTAYMYGAGSSHNVGDTMVFSGQTYTFDGSNWQLTTVSTPTPTPTPTVTSTATVTANNASTTSYDPSLNNQISNMQATGDQANLINQVSAGQVQTINGDSVTAYMYGAGSAHSAGDTMVFSGQTYTFDGSNWQLTPASVAGTTSVTSSNASTTTYDPSLSSQISNMQATGDQTTLINQISAGQVPTINGNSVTAYMYGAGSSHNVGDTMVFSGQTYTFDGSNWQLTPAAPSLTLQNVNDPSLQYDPSMNAQLTALQPQILSNLNSYMRVYPGTPLAYMLGLGNGIDPSTGQALPANQTVEMTASDNLTKYILTTDQSGNPVFALAAPSGFTPMTASPSSTKNLNNTQYDGSVLTDTQIDALKSQLTPAQLATYQAQGIAPGSVLAYMLGLGNATDSSGQPLSSGAIVQANDGKTNYVFNGGSFIITGNSTTLPPASNTPPPASTKGTVMVTNSNAAAGSSLSVGDTSVTTITGLTPGQPVYAIDPNTGGQIYLGTPTGTTLTYKSSVIGASQTGSWTLNVYQDPTKGAAAPGAAGTVVHNLNAANLTTIGSTTFSVASKTSTPGTGSGTTGPSITSYVPSFGNDGASEDVVSKIDGTSVTMNAQYFLDNASSQALAKLVGGTVVNQVVEQVPEDSTFSFPNANFIKMPDGTMVLAGQLAAIFTHGYPSSILDPYLLNNLGSSYLGSQANQQLSVQAQQDLTALGYKTSYSTTTALSQEQQVAVSGKVTSGPTAPTVLNATVGTTAASLTFANLTTGNTKTLAVGDTWQITVTGPKGATVTASSTHNGSTVAPESWTLDSSGKAVISGQITTADLASDGVSDGSWSESWNITSADGKTTSPLGNISFTTTSVRQAAMTVNNPVPTSITAGTNYNFSFTASGGSGSYTWGVNGAAPIGMSLSSNGVLSGTPTTAGTYQFTVTATDAKTHASVTSPTIVVTVQPQGAAASTMTYIIIAATGQATVSADPTSASNTANLGFTIFDNTGKQVSPAPADIVYSSSNPAVANVTLSPQGNAIVVKGMSAGMATVTMSYKGSTTHYAIVVTAASTSTQGDGGIVTQTGSAGGSGSTDDGSASGDSSGSGGGTTDTTTTTDTTGAGTTGTNSTNTTGGSINNNSGAGGSVVAGVVPFFTTINPPSAYVGQSYSSAIQAVSNYSMAFTLVGGSLPPGLVLNNNGTITGTPTTTGSYIFAVQATTSQGVSAGKQFTMTVLGSGGGAVYTQTIGGQVAGAETFQGLQMPQGYSVPNNGSGLQMPAGYGSSQGLQMPVDGGAQVAGATTGQTTYTVKKGDTLWSIAKKYYGDGRKWRKILEANTKQVKTPTTLKIGTVLVIPQG